MTTFDDREKAFEAKYALDQEQEFKAIARRNKMLGLWAAEKMGLSADSADQYAAAIVRDVLESEPRVIKERERVVAIKALTSGGCEMKLSAWVKNEDYVDERTSILTQMRSRFAAEAIKLG